MEKSSFIDTALRPIIILTIFFPDTTLCFKVFSLQHCIDTTHFRGDDKDKYQSYFYGNRKKKLSGIVVPEEEISKSLLVDDDNSYMTAGEEYNFIYLKYCYQYLVHQQYDKVQGFFTFHSAYYLAGLFSKIFDYRDEKKCSLTEAAKFVQIDSEGKELSGNFYYPGISNPDYYSKGLSILSEFDSTLKYYYELNL